MAVLKEILEWSEGIPAWERDALRRLVVTGDLSAQDIVELADILQADNGVPGDGTSAQPQPLTAAHLALPAGSDPAVVLTALRDLVNVNALAEKQTLTFAIEGLTVIYGDNGAGKSGYTRALKRICRARAPGVGIKKNVFSDTDVVPSGSIVYRVGSEEFVEPWSDNTPAPHHLGAISVFDTDCASVYVEDKTEVAYRPFGLDLLSKLAVACDRVKAVIQGRINVLDSQRLQHSRFVADGPVGSLLMGLRRDTTVAQVDKLAVLTPDEQSRIKDLRVLLAQLDVGGAAKYSVELRAKGGRLRTAAAELRRIGEGLSITVEAALREASSERFATAAAALLASKLSFASEPIPAVGTAVWKRLWEAAREFSTREAYTAVGFPNSDVGARCVLCQQTLEADARTRLDSFERFVQDKSQVQAKIADSRLSGLLQALGEVPAALPESLLDEIGAPGSDVRGILDAFLKSAGSRKAQLGLAASTNDWSSIAVLAATPVTEVLEMAGSADKAAAENDFAGTPSERANLETELRTLEERDRLGQLRPQVLHELERLVLREKLTACLEDTSTRPVTRVSSELTKGAVSDALCSAFEAELKALGLSHLSVTLDASGGAKGTFYHRVEVRRPDGRGVPGVETILSEGEQRCIALAAFLAELSTQESMSGIVLDDPVSSLDHERREAIAKRLVQEAKSRPVTIFTHDLVFLLTLDRIADGRGVPLVGRQLSRSANSIGDVVGDLPWYGLTIRKRIGYLKDMMQRLRVTYEQKDIESYTGGVQRLYGLLRESWERAVEEVLLNEAIVRFGREVQTKRLEKVLDITQADFDALESAMDKCSTNMAGHDAPAAVNLKAPSPDEVLADLGQLESWVEGIRKRRK